MLLLSTPRQEPSPPPVMRNKTGVIAMVRKAPAGKQALAWWIEFLRANW